MSCILRKAIQRPAHDPGLSECISPCREQAFLVESGMTSRARQEVIQVEDRWYVLATSARADDRTRVLKDGEAFGVYDRYGDVHMYGAGEQGLYYDGTRFLSRFEFAINGQWPLLLNSTVRTDNSLLLVDLTTPDLRNADGQVMIRKDTLHVF